MKPQFLNLINHDWDADYISYLKSLAFNNTILQNEVIKLAGMSLQIDRNRKWEDIKTIQGFAEIGGYEKHKNGNYKLDKRGNKKPIPQTDVVNMANPYYIGFGNPDADILLVGKEKGFDLISRPASNHRNYIDKLFLIKYNRS